MALVLLFSFFLSPQTVLIQCTVLHNPSAERAAKCVGLPYDRAARCSLMILISEKHLGAQPQLSGARPILMIFSPILTSKMLPRRSKCGVMHADGQCAAVRVYKRVRERCGEKQKRCMSDTLFGKHCYSNMMYGECE